VSIPVTGALLRWRYPPTDVDEFWINVPPHSAYGIYFHRDMPGIIGKLGSSLGSFNVNIASMVGRKIVRRCGDGIEH